MKATAIEDRAVPNFCWDRRMTAGEIREGLRRAEGYDWIRLASWILREAAFADVWSFLTPADVNRHLAELTPFLGRRRGFWTYLMDFFTT